MSEKKTEGELTHLTPEGDLNMVDVGDKGISVRTARAEAVVSMRAETARALLERRLKKGDAYTVARLAGIQAAKETARLIPLCHPLQVEKIDVVLDPPNEAERCEKKSTVRIESFVRCESKTGVEMEALTAVAVASLTLYDMCKAIDRSMEVVSIRLLEKTGGQEDFRVT